MGLTADAAHGIERVQICFARNTVADVVRGFQEFLQVIKSVGSVEKSDSLLSMVSSRDRILIFIQSSPQPLTQPECDVLTGHVSRGGSLLMLLHERMDDQVLSSGNFVLEGFGISVCLTMHVAAYVLRLTRTQFCERLMRMDFTIPRKRSSNPTPLRVSSTHTGVP
jgi:hypothetical protein